MEKLVNKLAELQAERKEIEERADDEVHEMGYDRSIHDLKKDLEQQEYLKYSVRRPFENEMAGIDEKIEDIQSHIIDEWSGEKNTIKYPSGTLKFRTTTSLDIGDGAALLANLIDHFSTNKIAEEYISGFNKTSVKKFMNVIPLPPDVAEMIPKTTVKLEQEEVI